MLFILIITKIYSRHANGCNNIKHMTTAQEISDELCAMADDRQAALLMRFFKCGKGEYGEGDRFLGLKVPQTRAIVKSAGLDIPADEIEKLAYSQWHEVRLCGFLLLVEQMKALLPQRRHIPADAATKRDNIVNLYLKIARQANNWDLVDLSCPGILGEWLLNPSANGNMPDQRILDHLAVSDCLWEQRIAIVSTLRLIKGHLFDDTLRIADRLLSHPHDLIQKATGWMLREVGKKDIDVLTAFLEANHNRMSRTTLRYAIERMDGPTRHAWLTRK